MEKIAVYGAGVIGAGEATLIIGHSMPCIVIGRSAAGLERCRKTVEQNWDDLIAEGLATEKNKIAAMKLLTITSDPAALDGCTFVFEAVAENVEQKGEVYATIEKYAASNAVIASCTSSLNAAVLAAETSRPENLLVAHPLQPAHMMPLVEVVGHEKCSKDTLNRTTSLLKSLDHAPVVLNRSVSGFLVNRFQQALYRESIYLIEQGITSAKDIDLTWKYLAMRYESIGVLEFFDDVGLPLESTICQNIYPDLCDSKGIQALTQKLMDKGHNGKVSGRGLHDWSQIDADDYRTRKQAPFLASAKNWNMPE